MNDIHAAGIEGNEVALGQKNESIAVKLLAIIGFSATILFIAWLIVVIIKGSPDTFASLANIVQTKETYQEEMVTTDETALAVTTGKTMVNSREAFQITWTKVATSDTGTYTFRFDCVSDPTITLLIGSTESNPMPIRCTDTLDLPSNVNGLILGIVSERERFAEVPLHVAYSNEDGETMYEAEVVMTVVNANIAKPQEEVAGESTVNEENPETPTEEPEESEEEATTVVTTPIRYVYPTSNPNGYTDLVVSVQNITGTGIVVDVKNDGTKTSNAWSFVVSTPTNTIYSSPSQEPLKPKEHAVFTFTTNSYSKVTAVVMTTNDINISNNTVVR